MSNSREKTKVDGNTTSDTKDGNIGVGLFYGKAMSDNIDLLLGTRMAFARVETTTPIATTKKDEGFTFAPTVGIEYNINKHVAVGGYVDYAYTKTEDKLATTKTETESFKTGTNLFVKYFF
jgi:opacity protein-like surface antigen